MTTATRTRKKRGSSAGGKQAARTTAGKKKRTTFQLGGDEGCSVYVAGSFNGWNPKKNKMRFKNGRYSVALMLPPGKYEYKFIVDGTWCVDPECAEWAPNGLGSLNSVVNID